ncbi:MAG TPA: hypothetical protein PKN33_07305 [Phycisphaerae bacterium]|nr:hypothetical protein [Phycisphaerae bacterium]
MGKLFGLLAAIVIFIVVFIALRSKSQVRELTESEEKIRQLVHEVYGERITSEEILIQDSDAIVDLVLANSEVERLEINLTNLARKHAEGVSIPVLKLSMRLGD